MRGRQIDASKLLQRVESPVVLDNAGFYYEDEDKGTLVINAKEWELDDFSNRHWIAPTITGVPGGTWAFEYQEGSGPGGVALDFNLSTGEFDASWFGITSTFGTGTVWKVTYTTPAGPSQNSSVRYIKIIDAN